jgi:hypothetical protein
MYVTRELPGQIAAMRSLHLLRSAGKLRFSLVLTAEECVACRFATGEWNDPLFDPVIDPLVKQVGWKRIENAPGRRAVLRCDIPGGDLACCVCTIDLGSGFQPLPIRDSEGN